MTYAIRSDFERKYGLDELIQLTDRADPPTDQVDDDVLAGALEAADAEIDAYVGSAYKLPLEAPAPILRQIGCVVARYHLHKDEVPEKVRVDYDDALKKLEHIAAGKISLDQPTGPDPEPIKAGRVQGISAAPVFTPANLAGF